MSLSEDIKELTLKISKIDTVRTEKEKDDEVTSVANSMEKIKQDLSEIEVPIDIMIENKIKMESNLHPELESIKSISEILMMTENFKKRFQVDKDEVYEPFPISEFGAGKNFDYFEKKCKKIKSELDFILNKSWGNSTKKKIHAGLTPELINFLSRVASSELKTLLSGIKGKLESIDEIANKLPTDKKVIDDLDKLVNSLNDDWKNLGLEREVIEFLTDAHSPKGAKYESLTYNVKDWLEKFGQLKNAKIIFHQKNYYN